MTARPMLGLWLEDGEVRVRDDLPVPDPPPGEARVRVSLAGVCRTDLELVRGYYPFAGVLGHEFVGVVEAVVERPGRGAGGAGIAAGLVGRRVVGEINAACGECGHCREGRPTHCARRTVLGIVDRNGAFAEYLTLPVGNLHPVPDGVPDEAAVFAEPLAAALEIREQVHLRPGARALLVGDGRLGQLVARALALDGCDVQVVGRHDRKLGLLEEVGIGTLREGEVEPGAYDLAVECSGDPSGFAAARAALRPRGTLVLKSTYAGALELDVSSIVVDELTLVGSRCGPFAPALRLLTAGRIDPRPLIDARYRLADAERALERAGERGVLKVLLEVA